MLQLLGAALRAGAPRRSSGLCPLSTRRVLPHVRTATAHSRRLVMSTGLRAGNQPVAAPAAVLMTSMFLHVGRKLIEDRKERSARAVLTKLPFSDWLSRNVAYGPAHIEEYILATPHVVAK
jgi:hypothetical protein